MNTANTRNTLKNDIENYLQQGGSIRQLPGYRPAPRPLHRAPKRSNLGVETDLPKFGTLPTGWLTKEAAADMLGYRVNELTYAARTRKLPSQFKCVLHNGKRCYVWQESDLKPFMGIPYKKLQRLFSMIDMTSSLRVNRARIMRQVERGRIESPRFLVREMCGEKFIAVPAWPESEFIRACALNWDKSASELPLNTEKTPVGTIKKGIPGSPWTEKEDAWLVTNYEALGSSACAKHIGRSASSVRNQVKNLRKNGVKVESKVVHP